MIVEPTMILLKLVDVRSADLVKYNIINSLHFTQTLYHNAQFGLNQTLEKIRG